MPTDLLFYENSAFFDKEFYLRRFHGYKKENYLDYVPKHNSLFEFRDNKKGHVEIKVHNKGFLTE